jgi:arogenate dehydrogenase (NADP+)
MQNKRSKEKQLTIGIVGFGTFGQFLAHRFVKAGHRCVSCLGAQDGAAASVAIQLPSL